MHESKWDGSDFFYIYGEHDGPVCGLSVCSQRVFDLIKEHDLGPVYLCPTELEENDVVGDEIYLDPDIVWKYRAY